MRKVQIPSNSIKEIDGVKCYKCRCDERSGHFETDQISIVSPSGDYRSIWMHKKEIRLDVLGEAKHELSLQILKKVRDSISARAKWNWAETERLIAIAKDRPETYIGKSAFISNLVPEWQEHIAEFNAGKDEWFAWLTKEELALVDEVSDYKIRKSNQI